MKKKTMKYTLFATVFLLASCNGILDKDPIATLDAGSFFQTQEDAIQAINAAYKPLTFSNTNNNFYWAFGVLASDEAITGGDGSDFGNATSAGGISEFTCCFQIVAVHYARDGSGGECVTGAGGIQRAHGERWNPPLWIVISRTAANVGTGFAHL